MAKHEQVGPPPSINELVAAQIEVTEHPLAPQIIQSAHGAIEALARLLAGLGNERESQGIRERLLKDWTDEEVDEIASDPNFIVALCACLKGALTLFALENVAKIRRKERGERCRS